MNTAAAALAPLPAPTAIRFVDNGDGTVTDHRTGLMWSAEDVTPKAGKHAAASKACEELRLAGYGAQCIARRLSGSP